ncbi:MAG: hypothetical protein N5P05_001474 [Chroococcopsis gigantea SAG 12.99]|nr:hypothetical protein [Chroococcopsis gigantea SAG 12.99]
MALETLSKILILILARLNNAIAVTLSVILAYS